MRRLFVILAVAIVMTVWCPQADAAQTGLFDAEIQQIEEGVSGEVSDDMEEIGAGKIQDLMQDGTDISAIAAYVIGLCASTAGAPLSALIMLIAVVILASCVESYTFSLRYTDTREVMHMAVSLFTASVTVAPLSEMIADASAVIGGASRLMLLYLPVMAGMLAFSGHALQSGGYYAAVVTASQLLSWLSAEVLSPVLTVLLSLSFSAGICSRLQLKGLLETVSKLFKWLLTFAMSLFIAVTGLNTALTRAGDTLAGRAARFTLSSLIPLVGSSIGEAYKTIEGSVSLLRSGMGIFVILAVSVSFLPLIIRVLLWLMTVNIAKSVGEIFSVGSVASISTAISAFLSALSAMLICVMVAFIIASAAMLRVGGGA